MKKEWVLLLTSVTVTLTLALGLLRWLAPGLLGIPVDLQMVRVSEKLPPFFEGVFRIEDYQSTDFILKDPYTSVRAKPLYPEINGMGPNDILGFRNRQVPNVADVVVIGDSQTYGNNATLEQNWPSQMTDHLQLEHDRVYAMAVGGWGAVQYLEMFFNAVAFQPRVVVVAFYSGNDPLDSFLMAYSHERHRNLRTNPSLSSAIAPKVVFPPPQSQWWPVELNRGIKTVFTPSLRYASNQDHAAVEAGYDVMAKVCELISAKAKDLGIATVFTIIPSKELVYWPAIRQARIEVPEDYSKLVLAEQKNIGKLAVTLETLHNTQYVNTLERLQTVAKSTKALYPSDANGHPLAAGYRVIGKAVAEAVKTSLPEPPQGLVALQVSENAYQLYAVKEGKAWWFGSTDSVLANGWNLDQVSRISLRELAGLEKGIVDGIDVKRFGPN